MEEIMKKMQFPVLGQSAQGYDPVAHARMKADSFNSIAGTLTGVDCPKCKNRGQIAKPREDGSVTIAECGCMKIRRCVWKMERSGLRNVIQEYTFQKFQADKPWQQTARDMAQSYAGNPTGWFLACGQSGSGKTHLCTAICRELLLSGKQVVYSTWRQDVAELKAMSLDSEHREKRLDDLKRSEYLYLDDLFKTGAGADGNSRPTSADVNVAYEILNYRYINNLPTIISTELLPEDLLLIDQATGGRIVEKANGNTLSIGRDTGKNFRLKGIVTL